MRRLILLVVVVLALAGCAPSEDAIRAAIEATAAAEPTDEPAAVPTEEPTATAEPSPEPTAVPTDEPEPTVAASPTPKVAALPDAEALAPLLVVDGDLPEHLAADFTYERLTSQQERLAGLPRPATFVTQEFYNTEDERRGGAVIVYVYDDAAAAARAYQATAVKLDGLAGTGVSYPGDTGERAKLEDPGGAMLHLVFLRCNAFVYTWMTTERDFDIVTYAQRLDERLGPVVCPAG